MKLILRRAAVRWTAGKRGDFRLVTTDSGALSLAPFSSTLRQSNVSDGNTAVLIAAAHAASFSQALAQELGKAALLGGDILTLALVTMELLPAGWTMVNTHLNVVARLPHATQGRFIDAAVRAKTLCPVSRALRVTISMNAKLEREVRRRRSGRKTPQPGVTARKA
ncbi:MAG: OsmC family peroxiredoxin [Verrucomicrobia bacterium]|nr:OsmC family peroxiredoxin [Verrucomicrobiota bacterium]